MSEETKLTATDFQNGCFHLHVKDGEIQNGFRLRTHKRGFQDG